MVDHLRAIKMMEIRLGFPELIVYRYTMMCAGVAAHPLYLGNEGLWRQSANMIRDAEDDVLHGKTKA